MEIFARDVAKFEKRVLKAFKGKTLTQAQFDAAVSFDFNTGVIYKASWVDRFVDGNISGAKRSFMNWRKPKDIIPRRQKERDLFFDGKYSGNGKVNVYPATKPGRVRWSEGQQMRLPHKPIAGVNHARPSQKSPKTKSRKTDMLGIVLAATGSAVVVFWEQIEVFCGVVLMEWLKLRVKTRFKGYKTTLINIFSMALPILEMSEFIDVIPGQYESAYAIALALVNMYLRSVTSTPIGKSL